MGNRKILWATGRYCGQQEDIVGNRKILRTTGRYCGQMKNIVDKKDIAGQRKLRGVYDNL
ncbi:hypothetical protein ACKX2D_00870 [Lachnospiraceae bacterium YH-ros2226]